MEDWCGYVDVNRIETRFTFTHMEKKQNINSGTLLKVGCRNWFSAVFRHVRLAVGECGMQENETTLKQKLFSNTGPSEVGRQGWPWLPHFL